MFPPSNAVISDIWLDAWPPLAKNYGAGCKKARYYGAGGEMEILDRTKKVRHREWREYKEEKKKRRVQGQ